MAEDGVPAEPSAVCDGGDLDCGSGLLLVIREHMAPLAAGLVLEVRSRETSVREDLPAWCRMVGHVYLGDVPAENRYRRYFVRKGGADSDLAADLAKARAYRFQVRVRSAAGMEAKAYARNHSFPVGQPASFDAEDVAPAAVEYLLAALAGCLAVGFRIRTSRRGIEVRDVEVALSAGCDDVLVFLGLADEGNPGLARIEGTLFAASDADEGLLRELFEETVRRSPVAQSLATRVPLALGVRAV